MNSNCNQINPIHLANLSYFSNMWSELYSGAVAGNQKSLSRLLSLVENKVRGYDEWLSTLNFSENQMVVGITGPPGAGKSTLTDALIEEWVSQGKKVGVICVDPSSPFHLGALLGDRIRMSKWHDNESVFIRSLASRGSLGGLHPMILEMTDVMRIAGFDVIIIETVGVGQSEIEIAGLADKTVVVLVPESGDEIQIMKAGLMEVADIFVVNKSDRPGSDQFIMNLKNVLHHSPHPETSAIPVLKTVALDHAGTSELSQVILNESRSGNQYRRNWLMAERALNLIARERIKDIDKQQLLKEIEEQKIAFNLYRYIKKYVSS